jgi:hypothetical protein
MAMSMQQLRAEEGDQAKGENLRGWERSLVIEAVFDRISEFFRILPWQLSHEPPL